MSASLSPSAERASLRDLIEAIPEEDWTPIPYWMDGAAYVAETTYTPFQTKPDAAPVRLSSAGESLNGLRPVSPSYSYHCLSLTAMGRRYQLGRSYPTPEVNATYATSSTSRDDTTNACAFAANGA